MLNKHFFYKILIYIKISKNFTQNFHLSMIFTGLCSFFILSGCQSQTTLQQQESYVFGTRVEISISQTKPEIAQQAITAALHELDRLHRQLHPWQIDSELSQVNRAFQSGQLITLSAELTELIRHSQQFEQLSDGLFNPAIGLLIREWGFQQEHAAPAPPPAATLHALLSPPPSTQAIELNGNQAHSRQARIALDFGGMAKGWALDRVAQILHQHQVEHALINIGGNILAMGQKAPKQPWRVGIQHPRQGVAMAVVNLADGEAIGTSGDYQRYFVYQNQRYCHLILPKTGYSTCQRQSATVLISGGKHVGLRSDVASKPIYFSAPAQIINYAQRFGVAGVLLVEGNGEVRLNQAMQSRVEWLIAPPHSQLLD